jgi:hypothetical protein
MDSIYVRNIIVGLKTNGNQPPFGYWLRKNSYLILLSLLVSYMDMEFGDAISLEEHIER